VEDEENEKRIKRQADADAAAAEKVKKERGAQAEKEERLRKAAEEKRRREAAAAMNATSTSSTKKGPHECEADIPSPIQKKNFFNEDAPCMVTKLNRLKKIVAKGVNRLGETHNKIIIEHRESEMCNQDDAAKISDLANITDVAFEYLQLVVNFDIEEDDGKLHRRTEAYLNMVQKLERLEKNSNYDAWPNVTQIVWAILGALKKLQPEMNSLRESANE